MPNTKNIIGIGICIASILLGLYVGLWVCFIGGIIQVVESVKMNPVDALGIAIGVLRFIGSSFCGWLSFVVGFGIGRALLD